jgi:hypothetical protein
MSNPDSVPKKNKQRLYVVIMAVALIVIIVVAASFYYSGTTATTPTLSSMAGTYAEQTSSGTGYTIILYENGTGLFSTYAGTWHIVNATTFEGTYRILGTNRNDLFTITNNGFTSYQTGNVYVKK